MGLQSTAETGASRPPLNSLMREAESFWNGDSPGNLVFPDLQLAFEKGEGAAKPCLVVHFIGKISNSNSYELNRKTHVFFEHQYPMIFDLSRLEYINSSGVAILFSVFFRSQQNGHRLIIGGVHPFLKRVFNLMDLPDGLVVLDSLAEARATI